MSRPVLPVSYPSHRLHWAGFWSLVALVWVLMIAPAAASAQPTPVPITVEQQEAKPNFPDTVEFTLRARGFRAERAVVNWRVVGVPRTHEMDADLSSPTADLDLSVVLDLGPNYISPGVEVAYYWTLTGAGGVTVDTPEKTFLLLDDNYAWQSLTDAQKRVTVHWYEGGPEFGKSLLETASNAIDRLEHDIEAGLESPAHVWVYATQDELLDALPQNLPEWVGGKAFPQVNLVLAAIADDENAELEIKRVVPHELSHLVLYQATRNPYNAPPVWLDEGIAVYNQEAHDPREEEALRQAAAEGLVPRLKTLSGSFATDEEGALLSYAQSHSVVDFILNSSRYGPEKLARTVAAFREGVTYDEALEAGLGITVDELDEEWRASLPYEVAPQGSGQPLSPPAADFSLKNPLVLVPLGICTSLFLAGAVVTIVVLVRGNAKRQKRGAGGL